MELLLFGAPVVVLFPLPFAISFSFGFNFCGISSTSSTSSVPEYLISAIIFCISGREFDHLKRKDLKYGQKTSYFEYSEWSFKIVPIWIFFVVFLFLKHISFFRILMIICFI